ncbi:MAG TPA: dUTP diphosphatase [Aminobacterium sp.]|jgi:dUTP pyrophosphatase|uniref:dUTP diphosphatase n=2 Tax=Aminobacteriaceae TaxID=3029087 RepID=UPI000EED1223|nr:MULTISPECIES: dUTP diphosphatase [unclassified Aminobacterium]HCA40477.1 dUTP diphosphatase [Aminobacterium sp.]
MRRVSVKIVRQSKDIPLPEYGTPYSSGVDLRASEELVLQPGGWGSVGTGLYIELPEGYEAQVRPRSGLALRSGVTVLNAPGTIDSDYRGEIRVILINHGESPYHVKPGDRIAQMVLASVAQLEWEEVSNLSLSQRGESGFGSTGMN